MTFFFFFLIVFEVSDSWGEEEREFARFSFLLSVSHARHSGQLCFSPACGTAMRSRPPLARREDRDRWALRLQRPPGRIRLNGSQRRNPSPPRSLGQASPVKTLSCGARGHANGPTPSSFSHTVSSLPLCPSRTFLPTGLPPPSVTLWPIDPTGGEIVSGSALPPPANHSKYALLLKPNNYAQQSKKNK